MRLSCFFQQSPVGFGGTTVSNKDHDSFSLGSAGRNNTLSILEPSISITSNSLSFRLTFPLQRVSCPALYDQTGNRVVFQFFQVVKFFNIKVHQEVIEWKASIYQKAAIVAANDAVVRQVQFIKLAYNGFQNIIDGNQALNRTVFIYYRA